MKYVDANLDAPDNAILGNEPSSEILTSQSQTRGPVGLYRSPGVQNIIYKVLGFSHKQSCSMMENK